MNKILEFLNANIPIIVHCNTREESNEFLHYAKEHGIMWGSGVCISENDFDSTTNNSFRIVDKDEMWRGSREYYMHRGFCNYTNLDWADCIKPEFDEQAFTDFLLGE